MQYWLHEEDWEGLYTSKLIGVDTETPSLEDRSLLGIGVAFGNNAVYVTPEDERFQSVIAMLRDVKITKAYQNAPFDLRVMREWDVDSYQIHDTAIMARLCGYETAVLEELSQVLDVQTESVKNFFERLGIKNMKDAPFEEVALKCCNDALVTYRLVDYLRPYMLTSESYYTRELMIAHQLDTMSKPGIAIDQEVRGVLDEEYSRRYSLLKLEGENDWEVNLGSPKQVGITLGYEGIFLPVSKSKKGLTTDKETLEGIDHPLAKLTLDYRHVQKMLKSYVAKLKGQERAYTTLHMDAVTGRISSTSAGKNNPDMNLQNIPRKVELGELPTVRSMFIPDERVFTRFDLSQIELRVLAYMSGDERMQAILNDPTRDLHDETADDTELNRDHAKTFNFSLVYGAKDSTIAAKLGITTEEVRAIRVKWSASFPQTYAWMEDRKKQAVAHPYAETLYGRQIPLPTDYQSHMESCAVNYVIQGSAAEIFKRIMLELNYLLPHARLQIHDELVYDGDVEIPELDLSHISPLWTPLSLEKMTRWGDVEDD